MRTITINIETENDAFQTDAGEIDNEAVAQEIRDIAERVKVGAYSGRIIDRNGNTVGRYSSEDK